MLFNFKILLFSTITIVQSIAPKFFNQKCFIPMNKSSCSYIPSNSCFGTLLNYQWTSNYLVTNENFDKHIKLDKWSVLQNIPNCWQIIQPLLCSLYRPRCELSSSIFEGPVIQVPLQLQCELARQKCSILLDLKIWPQFMFCNRSIFTREECTSEAISFNNTASNCAWPLVHTLDTSRFYGGIEKCGLTCFDPRYSETDLQKLRIVIACLVMFSFVSSSLAIISYFLNAKSNSNKYFFFINFCFLISLFGWLPQYFSIGTYGHFLCRNDGTIHRSEPSESILYIIVFILIFYFTVAALIWCTILIFIYSQNIKKRVCNIPESEVAMKYTWVCHLFAWCFPLILFILCFSTAKINADMLTGIWMVGIEDFKFRFIFILLPLNILAILIIFVIIIGINRVMFSYNSFSCDIKRKIKYIIIKSCILICIVFMIILSIDISNYYVFSHTEKWNAALNKFIICQTRILELLGKTEECLLELSPPLILTYVNIFAYFFVIISTSIFVLKKQRLSGWKDAFKNICKRKKISSNSDDKKQNLISSSFSKEHFGMNIDLTSVSSIRSSPLSQKFWRKNVSNFDIPSITSLSDQATLRNAYSSSSHWSSNSRPNKSHGTSESHIPSDIDFDLMVKTFPSVYPPNIREKNMFLTPTISDKVQIFNINKTKKVGSLNDLTDDVKRINIKFINPVNCGLCSLSERSNSLLQKIRISRDSVEDSPINILGDNESLQSISDSIIESESNKTIASSDTDALSIELDENYQPISLKENEVNYFDLYPQLSYYPSDIKMKNFSPKISKISQDKNIDDVQHKLKSNKHLECCNEKLEPPISMDSIKSRAEASTFPHPRQSTFSPLDYLNMDSSQLPNNSPNSQLQQTAIFPPPYHSVYPSAIPYICPYLPPYYFYTMPENAELMGTLNNPCFNEDQMYQWYNQNAAMMNHIKLNQDSSSMIYQWYSQMQQIYANQYFNKNVSNYDHKSVNGQDLINSNSDRDQSVNYHDQQLTSHLDHSTNVQLNPMPITQGSYESLNSSNSDIEFLTDPEIIQNSKSYSSTANEDCSMISHKDDFNADIISENIVLDRWGQIYSNGRNSSISRSNENTDLEEEQNYNDPIIWTGDNSSRCVNVVLSNDSNFNYNVELKQPILNDNPKALYNQMLEDSFFSTNQNQQDSLPFSHNLVVEKSVEDGKIIAKENSKLLSNDIVALDTVEERRHLKRRNRKKWLDSISSV